jgi:hypothetical protein
MKNKYHDRGRKYQGRDRDSRPNNSSDCHYVFQAGCGSLPPGIWKKPGVFEMRIIGIAKLTPNMG